MASILHALPIVGLVLGLALLVVGYRSSRLVWCRTAAQIRPDGLRIRIATILVAVATSAGVSSLKYYPDANTMVYGFPFASFIFQRRHGQWLDFVGPLTVPALLANAVVGFLLPFVAALLLLKKRPAA